MKILLALLTLFVAACGQRSAPGSAASVIYGPDDRYDLYEVKDERIKALFRSEAALVSPGDLTARKDGWVEINSEPYGDPEKFCAPERFYHQPEGVFCSSVLIAPDLVLTAGHCLDPWLQATIAGHKPPPVAFVFDFAVPVSGAQNVNFVRAENIYQLSKLVHYRHNRSIIDFAVVQLDRPVRNRPPVRLAPPGDLRVGDPLFIIGHPRGIPAKLADNAFVREVYPEKIVANLDAYGGNSGSPVFNARTGMVEGLEIEGEDDFDYDSKHDCSVSRRCTDSGCMGEGVVRIEAIQADIRRHPEPNPVAPPGFLPHRK